MSLKEQLQQIKGKEGSDLYSHLTNVVSKLLLENPKNWYDILEDASLTVKTTNYDFKQHGKFSDNADRLREKGDELKEYSQKAKQLLEQLKEGDEDPQPVGNIGYVPNFMEEAKWFEQAGVGFGKEDSYRIFRSLTNLSFKKKVKNVRLWGKILCSGNDYWVAEGVQEGGDEAEQDPNAEPMEAKGTGVNQLNYWVTTDLLEDWVELPAVTPEQIRVSRQIKYMFTGDLGRQVVTNPHFPGKEQDLLKCQIVRIQHCTHIIPGGYQKVTEDEGNPYPREIEDVPEDELKAPTFQQLQSLENWVHYKQNILGEGRIVHRPLEAPEGVDDWDEEKEKLKQIQKDPFEPRLKPCNQDQPPEGYKQAWTIKTYGDSTDYNILHHKGTQNHGVIAIKSLVWPGQITVYNKQNYQYLYVGYGFKNSNQLYFPALPEPVLEEVEDGEDYPEPNLPAEQPKPEGEEQDQ